MSSTLDFDQSIKDYEYIMELLNDPNFPREQESFLINARVFLESLQSNLEFMEYYRKQKETTVESKIGSNVKS